MRRTVSIAVDLILSLSISVSAFVLHNHHPANDLVVRNPDKYRVSQSVKASIVSSGTFSATVLSVMPESSSDENDNRVVVTDLARYAIKGLSGDLLDSVVIPKGGVQTFPDDRRFALLKQQKRDKFDEIDPEWLHKENFLCAFSAPELMAGFRSHYEILEASEGNNTERKLTLHRRNKDGTDASTEPVLGPIDLGLPSGREALASFFSEESNEALVCVTKEPEANAKTSTFQFGNTRAGVKNNPGGDTRTVHLVNRATIREFSDTIGMDLNPMRFRPNIIIDGLEAWEEFNWVGRTLRIVSKGKKDDDNYDDGGASSCSLIVKVLTRTVRCEGIGIDPLDPSAGKLDVPKLLSKNYPEHGPYMGVYASLEVVGGDDDEGDDGGANAKLFSVGDTFELL